MGFFDFRHTGSRKYGYQRISSNFGSAIFTREYNTDDEYYQGKDTFEFWKPSDWEIFGGSHDEEGIFKSDEENIAISKARYDYNQQRIVQLEDESLSAKAQGHVSTAREDEIEKMRVDLITVEAGLNNQQGKIDKNKGNRRRGRDNRNRDERKDDEAYKKATRYNLNIDNVVGNLQELQRKQEDFLKPSTIQTRHINRQSKNYLSTSIRDRGLAGSLTRD